MNNHPPKSANQGSVSAPFPPETGSIINILYEAYSEQNYVLSDNMKQGVYDIYTLLADVDPDIVETVICTVCELCCVHEYAGFASGVRMGTRLYHELKE